jgi:hypothetical protein
MTSEPKNPNHIEDLIVEHFDGSLTEEQEKELAEALVTSTEAKQVFLSYMRMEGRLHSLGRDGFIREPLAEPPEIVRLPDDTAPVVHSDKQRSHSMRSRFLAAFMSLAVCAAAILMLTSGLWPSRVNASSVLQKAQQAAAELIDRTYRVKLSDAGKRSEARELTIDVRGGGRFVLRPVDGAYVMGSDGTDYWLTQQDGPVWVTSDRRSLLPELKRTIPNTWLFGIATNPKEPLLLEMADLLSLIERKYEVEIVDSASVTEHHVRATLRSGKRNAPEMIDFWADSDSGVALRAEIQWSNGRQMRFELVESATFSDRWYHYSQHAPGREVERLDAVKSQ